MTRRGRSSTSHISGFLDFRLQANAAARISECPRSSWLLYARNPGLWPCGQTIEDLDRAGGNFALLKHVGTMASVDCKVK
jgi:hypothetical protein